MYKTKWVHQVPLCKLDKCVSSSGRHCPSSQHTTLQVDRVQYELWPSLTKLVVLANTVIRIFPTQHKCHAKHFPKHHRSHYWLSRPDTHTVLEFLMRSPHSSASTFCEGPDSKYFSIWGLWGLCCRDTTLMLKQPQPMWKQMGWLCSSKSLLQNSWWAEYCLGHSVPNSDLAYAWVALMTAHAPSPEIAFSISR